MLGIRLWPFWNFFILQSFLCVNSKNYESYYRSEKLRVWTILNDLICIEHFLYLYQYILVCLDLLSNPQRNLNTRLGLTRKWLCIPPTPPHPTETQCQQYLSCYWPDVDETLKVGSCEHLEQIPTVRVTFVHATFVLATYVHIRNISAVTDPILMKLYR